MIVMKLLEPTDDHAAILEAASEGEFILFMSGTYEAPKTMGTNGALLRGQRHDGAFVVGPYDVMVKRVARPSPRVTE